MKQFALSLIVLSASAQAFASAKPFECVGTAAGTGLIRVYTTFGNLRSAGPGTQLEIEGRIDIGSQKTSRALIKVDNVILKGTEHMISGTMQVLDTPEFKALLICE